MDWFDEHKWSLQIGGREQLEALDIIANIPVAKTT